MALLQFDCNLIPGPLEHRYFRLLNCLRSAWSDGNTAGCAAEKILSALHQTNPTDPPAPKVPTEGGNKSGSERTNGRLRMKKRRPRLLTAVYSKSRSARTTPLLLLLSPLAIQTGLCFSKSDSLNRIIFINNKFIIMILLCVCVCVLFKAQEGKKKGRNVRSETLILRQTRE